MTDNLNLTQLREVAEQAAALRTEHGYTLPYIEAMRRMIGHLQASTVLALIERVQAAEAKLERVREVCESSAFDCTTRDWGDLEAVATDDVLTALDGGDQT